MRPFRRARRHGRRPLVRFDACVHLDLNPREARVLARAADLLTVTLRPELQAHGRVVTESPLVTAHEALLAACERAGVDVENTLDRRVKGHA